MKLFDMNSPLKLARIKHGLTLQQVADAIDIDTGNLSRIERGQQVPNKKLAEKLAKFFDDDVTETQIIYPERFLNESATLATDDQHRCQP